MVPGTGLEPARPCGHNDLNVKRIPISPPRPVEILYTKLDQSLTSFYLDRYNFFLNIKHLLI